MWEYVLGGSTVFGFIVTVGAWINGRMTRRVMVEYFERSDRRFEELLRRMDDGFRRMDERFDELIKQHSELIRQHNEILKRLRE